MKLRAPKVFVWGNSLSPAKALKLVVLTNQVDHVIAVR